MNKELLILSLIERGWFTTDAFLDHTHCQNLVKDLQSLPLRAAKIGRGNSEQFVSEVRNDSIFWLNPGQSDAQELYLQKMDELMSFFNRELYLGLKQFEGHFARYEKDGFYKKHTDQFVGNKERLVTVVTYLNTPGEGGELRIYKKDNPDEIEMDLAPQAGRLVCFLTSQIYHEVRPAKNERYSIAGWFRTTLL